MSVFKNELRCAFCNAAFFAALGVGLAVALMHVALVPAAYGFSDNWVMWRIGAKAYPISLFHSWIGSTGYSVATVLFYNLVPLLACVPYGDSVCRALDVRYADQHVVRAGNACYFGAKIAAAMLAGAVAVVVPLVVNLLISACCVPALVPEPTAWTFSPTAGSGAMLVDLFYENVFAYIAVFFVLAFAFAAFCALLSCVLGFFVRNRFAVVLIPLAACVAVQFLLQNTPLAGFAPLNVIAPYQYYPAVFGVVVALGALGLAAGAVVAGVKTRTLESV